MVELTGGAHAEWAHDDEEDLITVYTEDTDAVRFNWKWQSVQDARAAGQRNAELSIEWAEYLEANDCTVTEPC